jgi:hypothetical protein
MANDTGSNYFFIPGAETPAPTPVTPPPATTEPVSPFEKYLIALENLQPPVELTLPTYQEPAPTPVFSTQQIRRPTSLPTFQVTQTPRLGPIPSVVYGYDIPTAVGSYEPDLSNPATIDQPSFVQPPTQEVETGGGEMIGGGEPTESVEVGDGLITEANKNKYLNEFTMDLQGSNVRPTVTSPPEDIAPPEIEAPPTIVTPTPVTPTQVTPTPTTPVPEVKIPEIVEPPKTTFPIATVPENPVVPTPVVPTTPARVPVTPINRQPIVRPLIEPTTIPVATRRMIEAISPGYFKDINYDPEEILAAAMRSMGGRQARRSILSEMR